MQVVNTVQLVGQNLPAHEQVPQIGPGIIAAGITAALFIKRPGIIPIAGIFYNKSAPGSKEHSISGIAGWHNAVEHVDPAVYRFNQIFRGADPHEVDRLVFGQVLDRCLGHVIHLFLGFSHRQAAEGIAVKTDIDQLFSGESAA